MAAKANKKDNLRVLREEGTLTARTTVFDQEIEERQVIRVKPFHENARIAHVSVGLGRTINLGNYESARVDVRMDVPCYVEEAGRVYEKVMAVVERRITEKVREVENSTGRESSDLKDLNDIL